MERTATIEPVNLIMGVVAMIGAVLIIIGKGDYGLIFLVISTLMEAIMRVMK